MEKKSIQYLFSIQTESTKVERPNDYKFERFKITFPSIETLVWYNECGEDERPQIW